MNSYLEPLGEPGTTWAWFTLRIADGTWAILGLGLVVVVGIVGRIVLVSRHTRSPTGCSRAQVKGMIIITVVFILAVASIVVFFNWTSQRRQMRFDQRMAAQSDMHGEEMRVRASADGHKATIEIVSVPGLPAAESETSVKTDGERRSDSVTESTYKAVRSRNLFGESVAIPSAGCDGDREVVYHLRDPLKEWQRLSSLPDAARPRIERPSSGATATISSGPGSPPAWVADAGGSSPFSLRLGCVSIIGRLPGPAGELAGYSGAWQPDLEQAEADADRSVVEQLSAVLLRKLAIRAEAAPGLSSESLLIDDLLDLVEDRARVATDDLLVDRFVEERTRNYVGSSHKLYREAKLIRAPEERLAELTDAIVEDVHRASARLVDARHHTLWTIAAAAGLALVAFLLYSFINAGTKGSFAWPLRIVSLGALVLLYVGLFYFRGWIH